MVTTVPQGTVGTTVTRGPRGALRLRGWPALRGLWHGWEHGAVDRRPAEVDASPSMSIRREKEERADILIVTAVADEWNALLAVDTGAKSGSTWEIHTGSTGLRSYA
jgi:hypothetical protein